MKLNLTGKIVLTVVCVVIALIAFMVELPAVFRRHDTELHTLFYFLAAGFLNILFANRNVVRHVVIFIILYLGGVGIEYAQEYSNSWLGQRIHGRYDPEDAAANLKGLIYFSVLWCGYVIIWYATRSMRSKKTETEVQASSANLPVPNVVAAVTQVETSRQSFVDSQDEQKLQMAIQLLTEITDRNLDHRDRVLLQGTISNLKQIRGSRTDMGEKGD